MKIGDVEFQADKRKVTFYYTADGRIDFRELISYMLENLRLKLKCAKLEHAKSLHVLM